MLANVAIVFANPLSLAAPTVVSLGGGGLLQLTGGIGGVGPLAVGGFSFTTISGVNTFTGGLNVVAAAGSRRSVGRQLVRSAERRGVGDWGGVAHRWNCERNRHYEQQCESLHAQGSMKRAATQNTTAPFTICSGCLKERKTQIYDVLRRRFRQWD
jgi:hypothetical protein